MFEFTFFEEDIYTYTQVLLLIFHIKLSNMYALSEIFNYCFRSQCRNRHQQFNLNNPKEINTNSNKVILFSNPLKDWCWRKIYDEIISAA